LRVFVLGDPADANVVWPSQTVMTDKLKAAGISADSHSLSDSARIVAGWCYKDLPTGEILRKAAEGLRG
jgi:hypothetical protein